MQTAPLTVLTVGDYPTRVALTVDTVDAAFHMSARSGDRRTGLQ